MMEFAPQEQRTREMAQLSPLALHAILQLDSTSKRSTNNATLRRAQSCEISDLAYPEAFYRKSPIKTLGNEDSALRSEELSVLQNPALLDTVPVTNAATATARYESHPTLQRAHTYSSGLPTHPAIHRPSRSEDLSCTLPAVSTAESSDLPILMPTRFEPKKATSTSPIRPLRRDPRTYTPHRTPAAIAVAKNLTAPATKQETIERPSLKVSTSFSDTSDEYASCRSRMSEDDSLIHPAFRDSGSGSSDSNLQALSAPARSSLDQGILLPAFCYQPPKPLSASVARSKSNLRAKSQKSNDSILRRSPQYSPGAHRSSQDRPLVATKLEQPRTHEAINSVTQDSSMADDQSGRTSYESLDKPLTRYDSGCELSPSQSMASTDKSDAFWRLWDNHKCRATFLSYCDNSSLKAMRLTRHDMARKAATYLFREITINFKPGVLTKPHKINALKRVGPHVSSMCFKMHHEDHGNFLPPLVDRATGEQLWIDWQPDTRTSDTMTRKERLHRAETRFGDKLKTELAEQQWSPTFHAAVDTESFIRALQAIPLLQRIKITCSGQDYVYRHRHCAIDYALKSLRAALKHVSPPCFRRLSLHDVHPLALAALMPPKSSRSEEHPVWNQLEHLSISMPSWPIDQEKVVDEDLRILRRFIRRCSPSLQHLWFSWIGPAAPSPLSLDSYSSTLVDDPSSTSPTSTSTASSIPLVHHERPESDPHNTAGRRRFPKPLQFPHLADLYIDNATMKARHLSSFLSRHTHSLRLLTTERITLTAGDWAEALAPLDRMPSVHHSSRDAPVPAPRGEAEDTAVQGSPIRHSALPAPLFTGWAAPSQPYPSSSSSEAAAKAETEAEADIPILLDNFTLHVPAQPDPDDELQREVRKLLSLADLGVLASSSAAAGGHIPISSSRAGLLGMLGFKRRRGADVPTIPEQQQQQQQGSGIWQTESSTGLWRMPSEREISRPSLGGSARRTPRSSLPEGETRPRRRGSKGSETRGHRERHPNQQGRCDVYSSSSLAWAERKERERGRMEERVEGAMTRLLGGRVAGRIVKFLE